ncbi:hypothetical protein LTR99_010302 [Exophiala xenobiotica]|uniref:glucan endo-1,3-beta-D-glucosidase n=1 Tax=Vermiconidia calcicola TaxID=1690605 RepID=A0AAV9Q5L1_9PEZI|nr:hypothetical protein LTR96_010520 [Exophiala xenobiotica]KAK5534021.1 hypothetical protein LTR25_007001 [Vermiconidia calcicola]KAK5538062.1 hypothetical protein LTR23_007199 [Chaetothyriales sp. CCFEE 6169]KAK5292554.1 hypothetical protein LTR99_010302 [Exophiala xenobiotica]KAK5342231.1 hypothetical protein LTR98_003025 [Exophiala xenobiotica]
MSNGRTFSFEGNEDHYVNAQGQEPQPYQPHVYQDDLARDITSPPPRYASPSAQPQHFPEPTSPSTSPRRRPIPQDTYLLSDSTPTRAPAIQQSPQDFDDLTAPPPPPHRTSPNRMSREGGGFSQPYRPYTDGNALGDHYGEQVTGGGLLSVSQGVADGQPREGGLDAIRSMPRSYSPYNQGYAREPSPHRQEMPLSQLPSRNSYGSSFALAAGAATPGAGTPNGSPGPRSSAFSGRSIPLDDYNGGPHHPLSYSQYQDSPYQTPYNQSVSSANIMNHASINPNNILDDGEEDFPNAQQRPSQSRGDSNLGPTAAAAGTAGALGGLFGRKAKNVTSSGTYDPVGVGSKAEKSAWLASQTKGKRKMRWWVGVAIGLVVVLAIVAGIVGGVLGTRNSDGSSGSSSDTNNANSDTAANGDLGKDSAEIKALMNNKNLHKVFPGIDYTPWGTQYPLCFTYPPSQNNVTRDMAVLSQLTNVVRLYGTDCNQTQMVLHAIDRLELSDMKVWMGVWIDTNQTTTNRQVDQMYNILADTKDLSVFKGVIVGNEALYRAGEDKAQSEQELIDILTDVRSQFKTKGYDLPIATSDLGDNWNAQLVQVVDYVMSNIHPFFAGVTATVAAGWTWDFWQTHDVTLTESLPDVKQLISETGWPSDGGEDCGGSTGDCTAGQSGSIASVDGMNTFMSDWVCQALSNGTEYFWFEAFDEPWKVIYNTPGKEWEDKWGLMDPGRNLKSGLKIPDCDGKTVGS